jgi:hypothetical protein
MSPTKYIETANKARHLISEGMEIMSPTEAILQMK